jgi:hypothetical protein
MQVGHRKRPIRWCQVQVTKVPSQLVASFSKYASCFVQVSYVRPKYSSKYDKYFTSSSTIMHK